MKRFMTAYFFATMAVTLLANLVFILLYGRQFLFEAALLCEPSCPKSAREPDIFLPLLAINLTILTLFIFGCYLVRLLNRVNK